MKIFYDYQILFSQERGGISRYFYELYKNITKEIPNVKIKVVAYFSKNMYFKNVVRIRKPQKIGMWFINELVCFEHLFFHKYDIIHPTDYCPTYLFRFPFLLKKAKLIITVHDMTHEILIKDEVSFINKKKKLIHMADGIIVVSENTKNDLIRIYPEVLEKKIKVIYHGNSLEKVNMATPFEIPQSYILYVGHRLGYKNFNCLVDAIVNIQENVSVICVGGGNFTQDEYDLFARKGIHKRMIQKSLSDNELLYAYNNAKCLVFPSLYEGFGMPILEAFGAGCPVILSNKSCFPEIAGKAALYFEGNNSLELANKIELLLSDEMLREELIQLGKQRVQKFSWKKAAIQTQCFYNEVLSEGNKNDY